MQGVKLTQREIEKILILRLKHPDWSLRQISKHTRRHGKRKGVSHQTVKRILDRYPDLEPLKPTDRVKLTCDVEVYPAQATHTLKLGEEVRIIGFTEDALLVSHHHYPQRAIDIPPTAVEKNKIFYRNQTKSKSENTPCRLACGP